MPPVLPRAVKRWWRGIYRCNVWIASGSALASVVGQIGGVRFAQAGEHVVLACAEIEVRAVPGHHLAWIEQPQRVSLTLEGEQGRVGRVSSPEAFFP